MDPFPMQVHKRLKEEFRELVHTKTLYQLLITKLVYIIITQNGTTQRLQDGIHLSLTVDSIDPKLQLI